MKTKLSIEGLDDKFPVSLLDENDFVVASFKSGKLAREWAARNHYEVEE